MYLHIVGMHALGAGMYITMQPMYIGKTPEEFSDREIADIIARLKSDDAYALGLNAMRISVNSSDKNILDRLIILGKKFMLQEVGEASVNTSNLKQYIRVMFDLDNMHLVEYREAKGNAKYIVW